MDSGLARPGMTVFKRPAKAGIHDHRPLKRSQVVPHRECTAYGSPLSRGRQLSVRGEARRLNLSLGPVIKGAGLGLAAGFALEDADVICGAVGGMRSDA